MEKRELHSVLTDFLNERLMQVTASGQAEKNDFLKAKIRPVLTKGVLHFQAEEFIGKQAFHKNLTAEEAVDYLEMVRARARGTNTNILPKITTNDQGELREAIRHERRVELGLEPDRFYDLVRWGIASEVLHAAGKVNYQDKNALLPLPQSEIDKSKGVLVQNPDY